MRTNRGDFDAMFKHAARDAEVDMSRAVGPAHGVYSTDQWRRLIEGFVNDWESARIEPHEFIEVGEHVVVPITGQLVGRDGIDVEARTTWVWTNRVVGDACPLHVVSECPVGPVGPRGPAKHGSHSWDSRWRTPEDEIVSR